MEHTVLFRCERSRRLLASTVGHHQGDLGNNVRNALSEKFSVAALCCER